MTIYPLVLHCASVGFADSQEVSPMLFTYGNFVTIMLISSILEVELEAYEYSNYKGHFGSVCLKPD